VLQFTCFTALLVQKYKEYVETAAMMLAGASVYLLYCFTGTKVQTIGGDGGDDARQCFSLLALLVQQYKY
jgi:hypothetical protein